MLLWTSIFIDTMLFSGLIANGRMLTARFNVRQLLSILWNASGAFNPFTRNTRPFQIDRQGR